MQPGAANHIKWDTDSTLISKWIWMDFTLTLQQKIWNEFGYDSVIDGQKLLNFMYKQNSHLQNTSYAIDFCPITMGYVTWKLQS